MDSNVEISNKIESLLKSLNKKMDVVCKDADIDCAKFKNALYKKIKWDINIVIKVALYFGVSLEYLVGKSVHKPIDSIIEENNILKDKIKRIADVISDNDSSKSKSMHDTLANRFSKSKKP